MVDKRKVGWLYLIAIWAIISVLAWPAYVLCATLLAMHNAEGWQLDAWYQLPKTQLLSHFLVGYKASAAMCAAIGLVAVVDYLMLSHYRVTWLVGGILLPASSLVVAFGFYKQPHAAVPALLATGVLLAIIYRISEALINDSRRGPLR